MILVIHSEMPKFGVYADEAAPLEQSILRAAKTFYDATFWQRPDRLLATPEIEWRLYKELPPRSLILPYGWQRDTLVFWMRLSRVLPEDVPEMRRLYSALKT